MNQHNWTQLEKLVSDKVLLVLSLEEFEELRMAAVPNLHIELEECESQGKRLLLTNLSRQLHKGPRKGGEVIVCGAIN